MMTIEQENFQLMQKIRNDMIQENLELLLWRVEKVCRKQKSLEVTDLGFQNMSPHGYQYSVQGDIIKELQKLGYKCSLSFDPKSTSRLVVSGW